MFDNFIYKSQDLIEAAVNIIKKIWCWLSERWMPATALLSGIASLFAAYASTMSYQVSKVSAQVAEQSLKTTNRLEHEARLAQRARLVVQNIEFNQTITKENDYSNDTVDAVGLSLILRNAGKNIVSGLRIQVGTNSIGHRLDSANDLATDGQQSFSLIFEREKWKKDNPVYLAFEYLDPELQQCFYGQAGFLVDRDPRAPQNLTLVPGSSDGADIYIRYLKESSTCQKPKT